MINKWVRVMTDYASDGLWEENGCMMAIEDLPISDELKTRHIKWCKWYEKSEDYLDESERKTVFDYKEFSNEGSRIAFAIKDELPDWTVIYFNRYLNKVYENGPRHMFEYEIATPNTI